MVRTRAFSLSRRGRRGGVDPLSGVAPDIFAAKSLGAVTLREGRTYGIVSYHAPTTLTTGDRTGNFYQMQKLHLTIRANSIAFYHSGKLDETGGRKTRLRQLARELCMKRPARHRSSPMECAERLNPLAQQHRDPFSKHGLWRCDCTESEQ